MLLYNKKGSSREEAMNPGAAQYLRVRPGMTAQKGKTLFLLSLVLCTSLSLSAAQESAGAAGNGKACTISAGDEAWITQAVDNWGVAEQRELLLAVSPLPTIVAIDANCTFVAKPSADGRLHWSGKVHGETITLPDGKSVPFGVISFASPDEGMASTGFFAMSLPSVWRAKGIQSGLGLERLMDGVLLHEMTHTRQFYFVNPRMDELTKEYALSDDIGDDSLQDFRVIPRTWPTTRASEICFMRLRWRPPTQRQKIWLAWHSQRCGRGARSGLWVTPRNGRRSKRSS
jgi:hypothetical protein